MAVLVPFMIIPGIVLTAVDSRQKRAADAGDLAMFALVCLRLLVGGNNFFSATSG